MKSYKQGTVENFDNLRDYYPNIIELFARVQFYRNNPFPNEINDLIELYCLSLDNLKGKFTYTNQVILNNEMDLYAMEPYLNAIRLLRPEEGSNRRNKARLKRETEILERGELDKKNFFAYKALAFNGLSTHAKDKEKDILYLKTKSDNLLLETENERLFLAKIEEIKSKRDLSSNLIKIIFLTSIFIFIFFEIKKIIKHFSKKRKLSFTT